MDASASLNDKPQPKKWLKHAKNFVAFAGWVVAACSMLIPDQIEYVIKAVIEALKILLNSM